MATKKQLREETEISCQRLNILQTARAWERSRSDYPDFSVRKARWTIAYLFLTIIIFFLPLSTQLSAQCDLGKNYAVFFGVSDYDKWPDLDYPIKDITDVAGILNKRYAFDTTLILNPSFDEIWDQLYTLRDKTDWSDNDQLLLFFSGHGAKGGYFIPKEARPGQEEKEAIGFNEQFVNFLNDIPCRRQLIVIDACYSGKFLPSEFRNLDGWGEERRDKNKQILCHHFSSDKTRLALTAAAADELTPDESQLAKELKAMLKNQSDNTILYAGAIYQNLRELPSRPKFDAFHHENENGASFIFIPNKVRQQYEGLTTRCPFDIDKCRPKPKTKYPVFSSVRWLDRNLDIGNGQVAGKNLGRLYTWRQAKKACETLGPGWRLPTAKEWTAMLEELDASYKIKELGLGGNRGGSENAFDQLEKKGWNPQLAGYIKNPNGTKIKQRYKEEEGFYWTNETRNDDSEAVVFWFSPRDGLVKMYMSANVALSCRCVRDN